jgi:release factor glutamine methyltransferase
MNNLKFEDYCFEDYLGEKFLFKRMKDTFIPTATTNVLLKSLNNFQLKKGDTLDLGSGIGILGLLLMKKKIFNGNLFASDLSENSILSLLENAKNFNFKVTAKSGSLFDPWKGKRFDNIINDVSGISEDIAKISPWFKNVSCESGSDGTLLTIEILKQAHNYLNKNGQLFFPIISLSKKEKILEIANKNFTNVKLIEKNEWPLPNEMLRHLKLLEDLKEKQLINFNVKFGMIIAETSTYVACN